MALLILACTINIQKPDIQLNGDSDSGGCGTSCSTVLPPLYFSWAENGAFHTQESNNQLYTVLYNEGNEFFITNPYYSSGQGGIYRFLSDAPSGELETIADGIWTGDSSQDYLGINASIVSDGANRYLVTSEFGTSAAGRLLAIPESSGYGAMSSFATVDITGDLPQGYFGTGVASSGGNLYVSQTLTGKVYQAPLSLFQGSTDIADLTAVPGMTLDQASTGYNAMDMAEGTDGLAYSSFGGVIQHLDPSGTPDWWFEQPAGRSGSGAVDQRIVDNRGVSLISVVSRLKKTYALSVYTASSNASSETTYLDPTTGAVVDTEPGVVSVAEGELNGNAWTVKGYFSDYKGSNSGMNGYVSLFDANNLEVSSIPLPVTAPYRCIPIVATDGVDTVVVICRYSNQGVVGKISL